MKIQPLATTHQLFNQSDNKGRLAEATLILACLIAACKGQSAYPTHSIPDHQTSHHLDHDFSTFISIVLKQVLFFFFQLTSHSFHPCNIHTLLLSSNSSILLWCSKLRRLGKTRSPIIALAWTSLLYTPCFTALFQQFLNVHYSHVRSQEIYFLFHLIISWLSAELAQPDHYAHKLHLTEIFCEYLLMIKGNLNIWNYSFFKIEIRAVSQPHSEKPCAREISPTVISSFHSLTNF